MRTRILGLSLLLSAVACSATPTKQSNESSQNGADAVKIPSALDASELTAPLDKASIRAVETWLDDATFDAKWASMLSAPIEFFGGADAVFHADLATLPDGRLPGRETLCHGDPKLDNFGWTIVDGAGQFGDNDFDDAGYCPVAADALRNLVATDLWFGDASLDEAALEAYVATVLDDGAAVAIDPTTEPDWSSVRSKGLAKDSKGDSLVLGGETQAATADEIAAVRDLASSDPRFPSTILDVARNVRTTGGSAGWRRFWMLTQDDAGTRSIVELKEMGTPGTELGRHVNTLDPDPDTRMSVLKAYFWDADDEGDHFGVNVLDGRFLVRDRLTRANPKPDKMTQAQILDMVQAEASLLAQRHRRAWGHVKGDKLTVWLRDSAAVLTARWRAAYTAAGGK